MLNIELTEEDCLPIEKEKTIREQHTQMLSLACLVAKLDYTEIFYKIIQRKPLQFICFCFSSKGYKVSQERRN